ncbi:related to Ubiquinone biosynthesis monooxygenase COQ6 [Saccharomycodes ludwigii]|uniref:Ubiquinone biosynthesis monooxygenase COQ6, mitochondrial n=1 Tax=Saccharomycodes ludwigii TaxID=36035 RepID=A0A376B283_9ASCO|nr:related to Ubiquinone biosynthesis monooxygenase COQ6 [Saccharomycodes ludwigii]
MFRRVPPLKRINKASSNISTLGSSIVNVINHSKSTTPLLSNYYSTIAANENNSSTLPVKSTDILIVGGGPAGLTLAAAIKLSPNLKHFKTTLVDAGNLSENLPKFHNLSSSAYMTNRVVSITPQNMDFLTGDLNLPLQFNRIQPFDGIYVSDGLNDTSRMTMDRESMGNMVELLNIQSSAYMKLLELNANNNTNPIEIADNCKVVDIVKPSTTNATANGVENTNPWPYVKLDNGETYKTRLLIGCDGFQSPVRKYAGIETRGWFYNEWGVVATMKLEYPPFNHIRGWQRFLPTGPIAHLPLPGDWATLVWSTTPELSKLLVSLPSNVFSKLVNAAFILEDGDMQYYYRKLSDAAVDKRIFDEIIEDIDYRIEVKSQQLINKNNSDMYYVDENYPPPIKDTLEKSRARFPMKMFHADTYVAPRVCLVGDAAHATHPLAGQGLNMGLGDSKSLVSVLEKASSRGLDIGSVDLCLNDYWKDRYGTNMMLLGVVDKLHKLYGTRNEVVVGLRQWGLNVVNNLGDVKEFMMNVVSGRK